MSINRKSDPKFLRAYDRGMFRSEFVSLFWSIISDRRKAGALTLVGLAKQLGKNKAEVSRWFKGNPNWTLNTVASLSHALNVEIEIKARDRVTGAIYTAAGKVQPIRIVVSGDSHFRARSAQATPVFLAESNMTSEGFGSTRSWNASTGWRNKTDRYGNTISTSAA